MTQRVHEQNIGRLHGRKVYVIDGGTTVKRPRAAMVEWERFVAADAE